MSEAIQFNGGGAYPTLPYAQYPSGLGRGPVPPFVRAMRDRLRNGEEALAPSVSPVSSALTLVTSTPTTGSSNNKEEVDNTEKTREAVEAKLRETIVRRTESNTDFSGRNISRTNDKPKGELIIAPPSASGVAAELSEGIVRSPTKKKKSAFEAEQEARDLANNNNNSNHSNTIDENISVPFCVSDWQNKKNLLIPLEQRLANKKDERRNTRPVGSNVVEMAKAMRKEAVLVNAMLQQKEREKAEEEERTQAAQEQIEAQRARELLEEKVRRDQNASRHNETREERLQRIKAERELKERERQEKQRQLQLKKAAARLNITVEDLEADEQLLRKVDEADLHAHVPQGLESSAQSSGHRVASIYEDEIDANKSYNTVPMMASHVVSNEGIMREMQSMAADPERPQESNISRGG
ncbi:SNW domain-containing protein 1 [Angomonas deanei]|uniref:SKIP/SNW domain containing protein, putative n=1 Tax=Angomonas deanei TaxID=59799 RepID=A0A7G2CRC8_9TRYP|nr:SNW domain-containing protein 1 [Angomonas deanei]CAD2221939.1 SKIP/SNW domain containing protein, putative [Angomonas deanei]|eukprot:EPY34809.1 SNW domain-containing protein 1 [Angomonas deanei]